jgi:hypothetical protein
MMHHERVKNQSFRTKNVTDPNFWDRGGENQLVRDVRLMVVAPL